MKKVILACLLVSGAAGTAMAQAPQAAQPAVQQPAGDNELLLFGSKTNELEASLIRSNPAKAQAVVPELVMMMQTHIAKNVKAMEAAKDSNTQAALSSRVKTEMSLATEVKQLSVDVNKNGKEILAKVKAFTAAF